MKIKERPIQKTFKKSKMEINKKKTSKIKKGSKKLDINEMSVNDFMSGGFEDIDIDTSSELSDALGKSKCASGKKEKDVLVKSKRNKALSSKNIVGMEKVLKKTLKKKKKAVKRGDNEIEKDFLEEGESAKDKFLKNGEESEEDIFKKHKKDLDGLKTADPEFYNYLKENDQDLLNFDESDSDDEKEEELCHTAPKSLEIASDESDYEPEDKIVSRQDGRNIVMASVKIWHKKLPKTRSKNLLKNVVDAFHAAVLRVSAEDDPSFRYKVEGSTVFNAIIRMCVTDLNSGLRSFLKLTEGSNHSPVQSKYWIKIRPIIKTYLNDLIELSGVTSPNMLTVLLKHIHQMAPFIIHFHNISKRALIRVIDLWSQSEDVVRVLSFLCALRITSHRHSYLMSALKKMHMTYVRNTKFVSPNNLTEINFMRQSLSEMFALDDTISYQMAFIYIRQLAVLLRNAITLKKKENFQAVYNWQFISSLRLWAELFALVPNGSPLRSLVYPLIQIIIGTIKLIPSSQYYPLRFHCCKILITISAKCGLFIPVLPFLLEVLREYDFNREHKKLSMKPMDFTCLLRCSKVQMRENAFKDALIENLNNLLTEYTATECYRISFPDVFVPAVLQVKQFLKNCKIVNYTKKMKAYLDKVSENSQFIEEERKKLNFKLDDIKMVEAIETGLKVKGTPFLTYYNNWRKIYMQQQAKKVVDNVKIGDYNLPVIHKLDKKKNRKESKTSGPTDLFPSSSSDDDDDDDDDYDYDEDDESSGIQNGKEKERKKKKRKVTDDNSCTPSFKTKRMKKPGKRKISLENDLDTAQSDRIEDLHMTDSE